MAQIPIKTDTLLTDLSHIPKNTRAAEAEPTHTVSMLNGALKFDTHINPPIDIKRKTIHCINDHSTALKGMGYLLHETVMHHENEFVRGISMSTE